MSLLYILVVYNYNRKTTGPGITEELPFFQPQIPMIALIA
jgi:hypothetical protein